MYGSFPNSDSLMEGFNVDPIGRAESNKKLLLGKNEMKYLLEFIKEKERSKIDITYGCGGF